MAERKRGLCAGSGMPDLADTIISRTSLLKTFAFLASDAPLLCMTFFAWEWPAIIRSVCNVRYFGTARDWPQGLRRPNGFLRVEVQPIKLVLELQLSGRGQRVLILVRVGRPDPLLLRHFAMNV